MPIMLKRKDGSITPYKAMHPEVGIDELDRIRKELYPNGSKSEFKKEFEK